MPSNRPTYAADRRRLIVEWRSLGHTDQAERDLERIGRAILDRRGYDIALAAREVTRQHLDANEIQQLAGKENARYLRALRKRAAIVQRRLLAALREWEHLEMHARGVDDAGAEARKAAHVVEGNPLLQVLTGPILKLPPAGNPVRRRNGALKAALRAVGVTTREATDIVDALGWTAR